MTYFLVTERKQTFAKRAQNDKQLIVIVLTFRSNPVKVTMQHLHMSSENQELVKGMLKDLHGADDEENDDAISR